MAIKPMTYDEVLGLKDRMKITADGWLRDETPLDEIVLRLIETVIDLQNRMNAAAVRHTQDVSKIREKAAAALRTEINEFGYPDEKWQDALRSIARGQ